MSSLRQGRKIFVSEPPSPCILMFSWEWYSQQSPLFAAATKMWMGWLPMPYGIFFIHISDQKNRVKNIDLSWCPSGVTPMCFLHKPRSKKKKNIISLYYQYWAPCLCVHHARIYASSSVSSLQHSWRDRDSLQLSLHMWYFSIFLTKGSFSLPCSKHVHQGSLRNDSSRIICGEEEHQAPSLPHCQCMIN